MIERKAQYKAIGYEQINFSDSAAVGFANIPVKAVYAECVCAADPAATQQIVGTFRIDGQNPTATVGMILTDRTLVDIERPNLAAFRVIATETISHTLRVTYYG